LVQTGARFIGCTIIQEASAVRDGDFQYLLRGCELSGSHLREQYSSEEKARWYIVTDGTRVVGAKPIVVDGPHVRCGHLTGAVGPIRAVQ